jgi:hypothetical protein
LAVDGQGRWFASDQEVLTPLTVYWQPSEPKTWKDPGAGSRSVPTVNVPADDIVPVSSMAVEVFTESVKLTSPLLKVTTPSRGSTALDTGLVQLLVVLTDPSLSTAMFVAIDCPLVSAEVHGKVVVR